jgi:hypothetical protein
MLGLQLHVPRGSFYSPKGQRSRFFFICKDLVALCPWVHRTVRCTPDSEQCTIYFHPHHTDCWVSHCILRLSGTPDSPVLPRVHRWLRADHWRWREPLAAWITGQSSAHWTVQWIIDRAPDQFSKSGLFGQLIAWASDTVRCAQGGSRLANPLKLFCPNLPRLGEFPNT